MTIFQKIILCTLACAMLVSFTSCNMTGRGTSETGDESGNKQEAQQTKPQKPQSEIPQVDEASLFQYDPVHSTTVQSDLKATDKDMETCRTWYNTHVLFDGSGEGIPAYDFKVGDLHFQETLSEWIFQIGEPSEEGAYMRSGITTEVTVTHKSIPITVLVKGTIYTNYPTCEWTVWIENNGNKNTDAITKFYAINSEIEIPDNGEDSAVDVYTSNGSSDTVNAFKFKKDTLFAGKGVTIGGLLGKPSYQSMPFANVVGKNQSFVVGVGWSGQWKMNLMHRNVDKDVVRVRVCQENMNIPLYPGESIRSPLVSMQFYQGSVTKGQNIFRGWINDSVFPDGTEQAVFASPIRYNMMQKATTQNMTVNVKRIKELNLTADYFWMDAGWYKLIGGSWVSTGTWTPDSKRFPNGITDISKEANANGMGTVLWFEPERVCPGTETYLLKNKHKNWILFPDTSIGGNIGGGAWGLYNFSDDEATDYMIDLISSQIKKQGLSVYRQDFNSDPLAYWVRADKKYYDGRSGMCENLYVVNFYRFWDALLAENEGLIIDNCASGGRRLDLETIRRSVTVWRNDYCHDLTAQQLHTYGLSEWLPLHGTGTIHSGYFSSDIGGNEADTYVFRSQMSPLLLLSWDFENSGLNWKKNKKLLDEYLSFRSYYRGNYYPLTPFSESDTAYFAMQFTSEDEKEGMVLLYRRPKAAESYCLLKMNGLDPDACYDIWSIDEPNTVYTYTGKTLMEDGVPFRAKKKGTALVLMYKEYTG